MAQPPLRLPSNPLPPEEIVDNSKRRQRVVEQPSSGSERRESRWLKIGVVLAVLLVGVVLAARPVYRGIKQWRSRELSAQSAGFLKEGKVREAYSAAQAAYRLTPGQPEPLRAMGQAMITGGRPADALGYFRTLVGSPAATLEDRQKLVELAMMTGNLDEADRQFAFLKVTPGDVALATLRGQLQVARKDVPGAIAGLREALTASPGARSIELLLGGLLLRQEAGYQEGVALLRNLGEGDDAPALDALMALAIDPKMDVDGWAWIYPKLALHPKAADLHRFKALELEVRCHPLKRARLLSDAMEKYEKASSETRATFAAMLMLLQEPRRVIEVLREEDALKRGDWLLVRLDALSAIQRWTDVLETLQKDSLPIQKPIITLFQARCQRELGNRSEAKALWANAFQAASENPRLLEYMVAYARRIGTEEQAREAELVLDRARRLSLAAQKAPVSEGPVPLSAAPVAPATEATPEPAVGVAAPKPAQ